MPWLWKRRRPRLRPINPVQFCLTRKSKMPVNVTKDRLTLFEERLRRRLRFPVKPGRARRIFTLNTSECFENAPHFLHHPSCSGQKSARAEWMGLMGPEPNTVLAYFLV